MSYLGTAFIIQYDCYHVESKGPVLDIIGGKKIAYRPEHSGFLCRGYRRLGWAEVLVRPGLYLDKDERAVAVDHNQVDFPAPAGEVAGERFETFTFEELLAAFFTPSSEQLF